MKFVDTESLKTPPNVAKEDGHDDSFDTLQDDVKTLKPVRESKENGIGEGSDEDNTIEDAVAKEHSALHNTNPEITISQCLSTAPYSTALLHVDSVSASPQGVTCTAAPESDANYNFPARISREPRALLSRLRISMDTEGEMFLLSEIHLAEPVFSVNLVILNYHRSAGCPSLILLPISEHFPG
jgi:hypothetical protein